MRTLAIVGSNPSTKDLAPYDDPAVEIWAFNEALSQRRVNAAGEMESYIRRADVIFQLHDPLVYRDPNNRSDPHHWDWLQEQHPGLTIYMKEVDPQVPNSARLPIEELDELLDGFRQGRELERRRYLTSTPAIALALAIRRGYPHILIYGIDMASDTEYRFQREGVTFWIGYALGRGIRVDMISGDEIFSRPVYGYEGYVCARAAPLEARAEELRAEVDRQRLAMRAAEDALYASWMNGAGEHITDLADASHALGRAEGALYEIERYLFKVRQQEAAQGWAFIDRNEYERCAAAARRDVEKYQPLVHRTAGHIDLTLASWQLGHHPAHLENLKAHIRRHTDAAYQNGRALGVYEENMRLLKQFDAHALAAGSGAPVHGP